MVLSMNNKQEKLLYSFLIFVIIFGVFARFWHLESGLFWRDEVIHFIAALKMNHHDSSLNSEDPRFWFLEHPQVATTTMGILTNFVNIDYTDVILMTKHYGYLYVPYEIIKQTFYSIRLMSAIVGTLVVGLVFLITRKLWGAKAGLWSAALISLSLDFVGISRIAFLEIFMIAYFLLTLVFFLKFLDAKTEKSRMIFLLLTGIFVALSLGTRWGPPFLLFPILFFSFLFLPKYRSNKNWIAILAIVLVLSIPVFYFFILGPEVLNTILSKVTASVNATPTVVETQTTQNPVFKILSSFENVFGRVFQNNFISVSASFFFKHSYFFFFSFLVFLVYYFSRIFNYRSLPSSNKGIVFTLKNSFTLEKTKSFLKNPDQRIVVFLFFIFSTLFFQFSFFGNDLRYYTILFIPAAILMGKPLVEFSKSNAGAILLGLLIILNLFALIQFFPNFTVYGNFGTTNYQVIDYYNFYNLLPQQKEIFEFLNANGHPRIFTNLPNLLVFYQGEAFPIPPSEEKFSAYNVCEQDLDSIVKDSYIIMLSSKGFANDVYKGKNWYCDEFMELNVVLVKEYGLIYENGERFPFGTISIFKPSD